ncbi:type II toxin-antitoxin system PemK/MazF family toxin [Trinickia sp.]|uniref:type II toxin-antitoxin system PemK/MazF family toxin n=1 Tax=Trinickia sp. TaxID=2571163 RepID=UPI003F7D0F45
MALPYIPARGEILICDFNTGFRQPEMVKRRPTIVVSHKSSHGRRLCTVVPLSTTAPAPVKHWHYDLSRVQIPGWDPQGKTMWAKCDMLATVSFERLTKPYKKTQHSGRKYTAVFLCPEDLSRIDGCIKAYLGLNG